ncbi:MAG: hypothetical protein ACTSVO_13425 [Candidatus Heimdallarchaeaceae archaeon]
MLKTSEIISLSLILIGVLIQIILQALFCVLYFFIPAIIIGAGFILFGIGKIIEDSKIKNKKKRLYEGMRFFHDRPIIIAVLSLIVGIVFPLGEWFFQYGEIWSIFELVILGEVFRAIKILILMILIPITIALSFYYRKNEENKMILILPEILLTITLFASLFVNIGIFFSYLCYSVVQSPSCFSTEYYIITTSFIFFIATYFVKLLYVYQLRKKNISRLEQEFLEDQIEPLQEDQKDTIETKPKNLWRLIKESFSAESYWAIKIKWKYNSRKHFITRFIISFVVFFPLLLSISFLTVYILSNR